jgi:alkanesulfonate monooxygenase SsuD/methylene tetrahydromethanopterin reductase-like flavin-dependent oxidoreductase (luciferase family)
VTIFPEHAPPQGSTVSFGIKTSQTGVTYQAILAAWREADLIPVFEHAWLWDHMVPLRGDVRTEALEAWTLLSALAAQTSRLKLGVMVTDNRLRLPTLLAKMAAAVDIISEGRLVFGIGVGACVLRNLDPAVMEIARREFDAYGVGLVSAPEAIGALDEALTITRRLWTESDPFDFSGRHYRLKGAIGEPKPVQRPGPQILVGAAGERLSLRVVARHADIWNCPTRSLEEFRQKSAVLDAHCRDLGRDPGEIVRSMQFIITGADPVRSREEVMAFIDAGVRHVVLAGVGVTPGWLAAEIAEPIAARSG